MFLLEKKIHCSFQKWLKCSLYQKRISDIGGLSRVSTYTNTKRKNEITNIRKYYYGGTVKFPVAESHSLCNFTNRNRRLLQTVSPNINRSCSYHGVQYNLNSVQRTEKNFLTISCNGGCTHTIKKRHLSLAWLDSLAVTQASWFQALAKSQLVEGLMGGLQVIHDSLHIPWWMSIIVSSIMLRGILTFPLAIYQNHIFAKVENLKPEMNNLVKELKKETGIAIKKFGWTESHARLMFNRSSKRLWKELIIRENCHPFKASVLIWVQIPLWVAMSMAFRNMASMMPHQDAAAQILFLEFCTGGISWIPNLTDVDHSLILPIAMGISNLLITEVNALSKMSQSRVQNIITNVFRGISIAIIPIAATVPSCVVLYWVTSSVCGLVQNLALMHPQLRQACGIPKTESQNPTPYLHLWTQLQKKLTRKK